MAVVIDGSGDARMREYSNLAADLEQQELEAADGVASPQVYGQLLAIYILQDDLPNAKFLWKRIPQSIKQTRSELGNIWKVGQGLWYKDFPAIYTGLAQEWPDYIRPVMLDLGERTRQRALNLVAKAYSSISLDDVASFLGVSRTQVSDVVTPLGWTVDMVTGMATPKYSVVRQEEFTPSEEQLAKLTDFVAFLEN
ncbi:COP9 signalosome complex subunit 8-like isoform X1 [Ornithodoros turicata]|uniref:COP9 signalosome complex subunit 8-like isoform X1 n=1 Tax=Ornithodoros turicata TaxID=34597 RepID=UPI003138F458